MTTEYVNPMDLLKEEMDNDDIAIRVNAIHRIKIICTILGPENTKSQLLPFLESLIKKEDDEVLFAIAEQLGNLGQIFPQFNNLILNYLEILASAEETVVRDTSVKSLIIIASAVSEQEITSSFVPMIMRLSNPDLAFTSRVSAISILCSIYPKAGSNKDKLRQKFMEMANEETPMVRRAAALKIPEIAKFLERDNIVNELFQLFRQLVGDEQDTVRVICVEHLKQLASLLSKEDNKNLILPVIIGFSEEKSWRVRLALAQSFPDIAEVFGKEITDSSLIQNFQNLLKDSENDVKIAATKSLAHLVKYISPEKMHTFIPQIQQLAKDNFAIVRAGVSETIGIFANIVGSNVSTQKFLPLILELLSDENHDVKIGAIQSSVKYAQVVGLESIANLSSHYKTLLLDQKWRVRLETLNAIITLSLHFQHLDTFNKHLEPLFYTYLRDKAQSVRDTGIEKLKNLVQVYKIDWVNQNLLPKLNETISKDNGYLTRIAGFYSLQSIAQAANQLNPNFTTEKILPILSKSIKDPIPNIRFVIIKIWKHIWNLIPDSSLGQIKQILTELQQNDTDRDVQYYAEMALSQ